MSKLERKEIMTDKGAQNFPGPGYYHPKKYNSSVMKHFPVWSMYKTERDESKNEHAKKKERLTTPGPGYYNLNQGRIPGGPVYTLAKKFKEKKLVDYPGPGNYSVVNIYYPSEPKFSMGKEKKLEENNKQAIKDGYPGPGALMLKMVAYFQKMYVSLRIKNSKIKSLLPLDQVNIKFQLLLIILMITRDQKEFSIPLLNMFKFTYFFLYNIYFYNFKS